MISKRKLKSKRSSLPIDKIESRIKMLSSDLDNADKEMENIRQQLLVLAEEILVINKEISVLGTTESDKEPTDEQEL